MELDARIPPGPVAQKWEARVDSLKLVSPANKRKHPIVVVGSGLAGASAAASLAEQGYPVTCFCFQDSPRRAHSIAAQGGINAAKNYSNDGDSTWRLFYDTVKGGDFRSREANVYRLAQLSGAIIDQCVAQGVPLARDYGGMIANRSFGGTLVSRTFYSRGQTGQQLLLGAYQALERQVAAGGVTMLPRREVLDLVVVEGRARGVVARNLVTGQLESYPADAVLIATGGYSNTYYLSTNARNCNGTAIWRAYKRGAAFANPCFTQIHPTCIPVSGHHQSKLTLMSESLRNDGRIWVPKRKGDTRPPGDISPDERDYYLERKYPAYGNLSPRDISSRAAKEVCDEGRGVGPGGRSVYLDLADSLARLGEETIRDRYGNLFEMYERITGEDPTKVPMRIYPAMHYTMGGLWVDYDLMSTVPGLFVLGEANFSDHGANRLGASALMQGLADGYFVAPYTVTGYDLRGGQALGPELPVKITLRVWRQPSKREGGFVRLEAPDVTPEMSFLEVLDVLNEGLVERGEEPIAFDSDCREGICGSCGVMIDGKAHGKVRGAAACQLHMRHFEEGDEITVEPWRAKAFPVLKDLMTERGALDRIIAAGGYISAPTGGAQDANATLIPKEQLETSIDAAACIGCGACVASCPNSSAALFTGAKLTHLGLLPQGQPERDRRALSMTAQADAEGFGNCTWPGECQAACPKEISIDTITRMHRDYFRALTRPRPGMRFVHRR
ncbi:MAG: fumarate reductase/succinate dehydrogenase flavoprotein subunit [Myxococcaceae bacterium]